MAGDDAEAKKTVMPLIEAIGFAPVDTGSLAEGGRRQQPNAALYNLLSPQDEVIPERRAACNQAFPPLEWPAREQCYRASAGHPNVAGARRYAGAILAALGPI